MLAVALGVLALVLRGGASAAPRVPAGAVRVDVGGAAVSRPVSPGFVGLSIEYRSASYYFGSDPARPNPLFLALVRRLAPGQSPVLRFGGDTTDWTWWKTPGRAKPPGVKDTIGPRWAQITRAAARALDARLILGVNLEADDSAVARTEANQLLDRVGRRYVEGLELGNEPEVYGALGWYAGPDGVGVPGRPSSYGFGAYLSDWRRISAALPGGVPLAGPASGAPRWLAGLRRYLAAAPRVRVATFHRYPLMRCHTPRRSARYPTIAHLLAPAASTGLADSVRAAVAAAHARGVRFRVDELNSVACGGKRGVSDTFASSLWILDTLFAMARVGVDGVNVHTFRNAFYESFAFHQAHGSWTAQVKPLYYGMLLFARAAPPGSRLLATRVARREPLRVWSTRAPDGRIRVVLINRSPGRTVTAAVRAPGGMAGATAQALLAPSLKARGGITLAGQTFGASTASGAPEGRLRAPELSPVQGRLVVRLPPGSATLLTVRR